MCEMGERMREEKDMIWWSQKVCENSNEKFCDDSSFVEIITVKSLGKVCLHWDCVSEVLIVFE